MPNFMLKEWFLESSRSRSKSILGERESASDILYRLRYSFLDPE